VIELQESDDSATAPECPAMPAGHPRAERNRAMCARVMGRDSVAPRTRALARTVAAGRRLLAFGAVLGLTGAAAALVAGAPGDARAAT
jgi:hypothetical protein